MAHQLKDKAEAAYARGDLLQKRRRLMEAWETFMLSALIDSGTTVQHSMMST